MGDLISTRPRGTNVTCETGKCIRPPEVSLENALCHHISMNLDTRTDNYPTMRLSQRNIDVGQRIVSLYLTQHKEGVIENATDCQSELYSHCVLKQYPSSAHATRCRLCRTLRSPTPMVESEHEHEYISAHRSLSSFLFFFHIHLTITHSSTSTSRPKSKTNSRAKPSKPQERPSQNHHLQPKPNPTQSRTISKKDGPLRRLNS